MKYLAYNPRTYTVYTSDNLMDLIEAFCSFTPGFFQAYGYKKSVMHTYSKEWTEQEIRKDRSKHVARQCGEGNLIAKWTIFGPLN